MNQIKNLLNESRILLGFVAGAAGSTVVGDIMHYKKEKAAENTQNKIQGMVDMNTTDIKDRLVVLDNKMDNLANIVNEHVLQEKAKFKGCIPVETKNEISSQINSCINDAVKIHEEFAKTNNTTGMQISDKMNKTLTQISKILEDIDKNKDKFIPDIKDYIPDLNSLYAYLDGLSLLEKAAFFNFLVYLIIILTLISIVAALFGNEIIKYFDLENRYPFLEKYFKIRAKLQKYYLSLNIFILFFVSIASLTINLLIFC